MDEEGASGESVRATTLEGLALEFGARAATLSAQLNVLAFHFGERLVRQVQANASGAPGPNIISGAYVNSIQFSVSNKEGAPSLEVFSDSPYSMRLELGFVGTDSLGRQISQAPRPHFAPAIDQIMPEYEDAIASAAAMN